jgi:3-hydroxyisobutyrate dehydrogenase
MKTMELGWIGIGRMGMPMVSRLLAAGHKVKVWNRTRAKAKPLVKRGAVIVDTIADLRTVDVVFTMLATGTDALEVLFGPGGLAADAAATVPRILVDCSTIGVEESAALRAKLAERGVQYLAAPVSGNPKCVQAGKLSCVASGPKAAYDSVEPLLLSFAQRGAAYAGEGELARICKIAHNVLLAGLFQSLIEVTLLAEKHGVPRHAFLKFINNSVLGSIFTRYKSPALANLDFTTTLPVALLKKDIDLGLDAARRLNVAMPIAAAVRELVQTHIGAASLRADTNAYLAQDFAALIDTMALAAGMTLTPDNVPVPSGLELSEAAE